MKYNEEMFNQTLKAADLSTVDFESSIAWDDAVLKCGEKYLNALLGEEIPKRQCFGDADRYYYMMGLLMAFFVVGYNLKPDYFNED